jgi:two-component system response regulator WspF
MRVAIASESDGVTAVLRQVVSSIKGWRVAWAAADGRSTEAACVRDRPDLLLLSLDLGGPATAHVVRRIMRDASCLIIAVAKDPRTQAGLLFEVMGAGAVDAITTPSVGADGRLAGLDEVARRLRTAGRLVTNRTEAGPAQVDPAGASAAPLVAVGASTGGPAAVARVLASLPADLPAGVVVVQHVDAQFAPNLVAWLDGQTPLAVRLAKPGDRPSPGVVSVTGSNDDLALTADLRFAVRRPRDGTFYHPSVDVFFESVAAFWPTKGVAALLTGIGRDGAEGLLALRRKGWHTLAQDEQSSVVFGMPKAAAELKAAAEILPIDGIGMAIVRAVQRVTGKRGACG